MSNLKELSNDQLLTILDEHDCKISEMDGCDCLFVRLELDRRYKSGDISGDIYKPLNEQVVIQ